MIKVIVRVTFIFSSGKQGQKCKALNLISIIYPIMPNCRYVFSTIEFGRVTHQPLSIEKHSVLLFKWIIVWEPDFCGALRDLVPSVQFKREKHPWTSVNFRLQPATLLELTIFHGCFSRFLNCLNGTKSLNTPHLMQSLGQGI